MPSTVLTMGKYREKKLSREGGEAGKRILLNARNAKAEESMGTSGAQGGIPN